jgi:hypothetical protein
VKLVRGKAHCRYAKRAKVDGPLSDNLRCVSVDRDVVFVADGGELGDWLEDAGFVVAEDGADEAGFRLQQLW